jgi:aryl-alcohol dehydrogenase-like predicted oxidoreductase
LVKRNVHSVIQSGRFDVPSARASLETSLRALDTEYIDVLLLHEGAPGDCTPELLDFLLEARTSGTIRAFGVATTPVYATSVYENAPAFSEVLQYPTTLYAPSRIPNDDARLPLGVRYTVTHGSFSDRERLRAALVKPGTAEACRAILDLDASPDELLTAIIVRAARAANPRGAVVFSSTSPERIRTNASLGALPLLSENQRARLCAALGVAVP